jgi:hypothetical protein
LSIGWYVLIAGGTVLSGCSGAEFGAIDSIGVNRDGALDTQVPTNDRNGLDGAGGGGGKGGSGGTGARGGGGTGGTGGDGSTDAGDDDGPDDDGTGTTDDAPGDNDFADQSGGDRGDSRGSTDSDRSGDVADVHPMDTPIGDAPIATDAKDAAADIASDVRRDFSLASDARDGSADVACSEPIVFYRDEDGDGFGGDQIVTSCAAPGDPWTTLGGDCRDDLQSVKPFRTGWPNPPQYSSTGYSDSTKPQGLSFDYDCTGAETADPSNAYGAVPNCGGLLNCDGAGYLPLNPARTGPGIDPRCGSTTLQRCNGKLLGACALLPPENTSVPYRCR